MIVSLEQGLQACFGWGCPEWCCLPSWVLPAPCLPVVSSQAMCAIARAMPGRADLAIQAQAARLILDPVGPLTPARAGRAVAAPALHGMTVLAVPHTLALAAPDTTDPAAQHTTVREALHIPDQAANAIRDPGGRVTRGRAELVKIALRCASRWQSCHQQYLPIRSRQHSSGL